MGRVPPFGVGGVGAHRAAGHPFFEGLRASLAVAVGYLPAAVAFGVAARGAGLSAAEAVAMSLVVFSGASQFALVGLLAVGASWFVMATVSLVLGARHVLYGPSLAPRLQRLGTGRTAAAAFGLTDEVFAVASVRLARVDRDTRGGTPAANFGQLLGLGAGAYGSWALGTFLGAVAGTVLVGALPFLASALSFALPALFSALLVSLVRSAGSETGRMPRDAPGRSTKPVYFAVATAAAVAVVLYLAGLGSWSVPAAGVAGPVAGYLFGRAGAG